jgi:hypothetical protein
VLAPTSDGADAFAMHDDVGRVVVSVEDRAEMALFE